MPAAHSKGTQQRHAAHLPDQELLHEIHASIADMLELLVHKSRFLGQDRRVDILDGLAVERRAAGEEHVAEDAQRPDVAAMIIVAIEDFWCRVVA